MPTETTILDEADEKALAEESIKQLMSRWRYPSLTIHRINVSGPGNSTLIPARASASISLRIVPDQDISVIKASLLSYLRGEFAKFGSCNELAVNIFHEAEPWVGDPSNRAFGYSEMPWNVSGDNLPFISVREDLFQQ